MAEQNREAKDFDELYRYVKEIIMQYDSSQSLSRTQVLRLKGLKTGKFVENKKQKNLASYPYKVILITFKMYSSEIKRGFAKANLKNENHKFNYACKVVENNLNDTYVSLKAKLQAKKSIESNLDKKDELQKKVNVTQDSHYKRKTIDVKSNKINDLW